ncbi:hypothetical protein S3E15_01836 [Bacillus mycoides]|uniref:Phage major capsid protein n=2 Tax=Bacillus mycoides TaxID=1405 RepID=A0AAP7W4V8_BACMY|nr:phage major capsid protein [Bacillus mycoides]OSX90272.1 hypothetical protein S3E15_01836 [Bacillus mycoides]
MKKMELRIHGSGLRSNEDGTMTVSGYVNKTEQLSEILGVTKRFKEKISRGAFSQAIQNAKKDIHFLAEHNPKLILASTRNGSLQLREDKQGLFMTATISPTTWGKDYYQLISDGILQNMSFGFRTVKDSWRSLDSGLYERTIDQLELFEVSVVRDPAYSQSTIASRSIEIIKEPEIPEVEEKEEVREAERDLTVEIYKQKRLVEQLRDMRKVGVDVKESLIKRETQKLKELQEEQRMIKVKKEIEERNLNMTDNTSVQGKAVAPTIVDKLESVSNAYARANKIPLQGEELKIPYETSLEDATWIPEGGSVNEINLNLGGFAVMSKKRLGLGMSLTNKLMQASGVDLTQYVQDLLIERIGRALEKSILSGSTMDEFKGIAPDTNVTSSTITLANPTSDQLRRIYLNVHEDVLGSSEWYMSRPFFEKVAALKDSDGNYYVTDDSDNDDPLNRPKLWGYPINISSALADGTVSGQVPILFGSIADCYTIGINKDLEIKPVNGAAQALGGYTSFVGEFFGDGCVTNYQAIAKGVVA